MRDYIVERVLDIAEYVAKTKCTVRQAALEFKISKSTVHKDMSERLAYVDKSLYKKVCEILKLNKNQRHLRGGEATKNKYLIKKIKQNKVKTSTV